MEEFLLNSDYSEHNELLLQFLLIFFLTLQKTVDFHFLAQLLVDFICHLILLKGKLFLIVTQQNPREKKRVNAM